jgi:tRNA (guanine-N7-)-methyltransferase
MPSRGGKVHRKTSLTALATAGILLDPSLAKQPMNLPGIFGNRRPVELEIGPGKGSFLLRRARQRSDLNFLGVEWGTAYAAYAADRAYRAGQTNIRIICADAADLFRKALTESCLWQVHVYFPDPWPKRKHHRRRLLKPAFIRHVHRALWPGGQLRVITDHAEYFRQICRSLAGVRGFARLSIHGAPLGSQAAGTNFGLKYARAGRSFYTIAAMRYRPSPG